MKQSTMDNEAVPRDSQIEQSTSSGLEVNININININKRGLVSNYDDDLEILNEIPLKRYRRRLADDIPVFEIAELIDLDTTPAISAPKNKQSSPVAATITQPLENRVSAPVIPSTPGSHVVDLTGEVQFDSFHNTAPLFEKKSKPKEDEPVLLSDSQELEQEMEMNLITINVKINNKIKKYKHSERQRFYELMKKIANEENVSVNSVFFYLNQERISPESTLSSVNHRISAIYTCHILKTNDLEAADKDKIELKFQSDKWRQPVSVTVSKFNNFSEIIHKLCQQVKFQEDKVSLFFDGESIRLNSTPVDMDLEGGEIMDCRVSN